MKRAILGVGVLLILFILGCASRSTQSTTASSAAARRPSASADLKPTQGNNVSGTIAFHEIAGGRVHVVGDLTGLTPGQHGFHIHEKADCSAPDAASAGAHFNPDNKPHGGPASAEHHAGDFGNIQADSSGKAHFETTVDFVTVSEGPRSVKGRSVVVHKGVDDLKTQPSGNSGARVACGVIQ
jgi:Cu-Zn family superoxide dismutase